MKDLWHLNDTNIIYNVNGGLISGKEYGIKVLMSDHPSITRI